ASRVETVSDGAFHELDAQSIARQSFGAAEADESQFELGHFSHSPFDRYRRSPESKRPRRRYSKLYLSYISSPGLGTCERKFRDALLEPTRRHLLTLVFRQQIIIHGAHGQNDGATVQLRDPIAQK